MDFGKLPISYGDSPMGFWGAPIASRDSPIGYGDTLSRFHRLVKRCRKAPNGPGGGYRLCTPNLADRADGTDRIAPGPLLIGTALDGMKGAVAIVAQSVLALVVSGCALGLPAYNKPFSERIVVEAPDPSVFAVVIEGAEQDAVAVPRDGRLVLEFPVLPRECSTYVFGMKVKDRSVEARDLVHFIRDGRVVKKLSVKQIRRRQVDALGFHKVRLR